MENKTMGMHQAEVKNLIERALIIAGSMNRLSVQIGITRTAIANWCDGYSHPRRANIAKIKAYVAKGENGKCE